MILRQYATHFGNTRSNIDTVDEAVSTLLAYSYT